jgi:hypothetical protein
LKPLLLALLALAGCQETRPCRTQTLLVKIVLDPASVSADTLEVDVALDGVPSKSNTFAHAPGDPRGTVEIDFPSVYPLGHLATITVQASAAGQPLGHGESSTPLADDCTLLEVDLATS